MSQPYGKARMQSPGTAERIPTAEDLRRRQSGIPAPSKSSTPVQKAIEGSGLVQQGRQRLKGNGESESRAYDWRQRQGLKRGR